MSAHAQNHEKSPGELLEPTYYVVDFARISFRELWWLRRQRIVSVRGAFRVLIAKLLRRPLRSGTPVLLDNVEIVQLQNIPDAVRREIQPLIAFLHSAGFKQVFAVQEAWSNKSCTHSVALISADRLCWAEITVSHSRDCYRAGMARTVKFYARRRDGHAICTCDSMFRTYGHIDLQVLPESGVEQLLALHRRRTLDCADAEAVTEADLREMVRSGSESVEGYKSLTHAFVPATTQEMERYYDDLAIRGDFSTSTKSMS